jgi:peroxiredoxin
VSITTFYAISAVITVAICVALYMLLISLIRVIYYWKTDERRQHATRLLSSMALVPSLIGLELAVLWLIFLPAQGRAQMAEIARLRAAKLAETSTVQVGDSAPDFSTATADGEDFTLAEEKGRVVVLNFFATWCGPCLVELPHIESIWKRHHASDKFRLLVVGREESLEKVREFREANGFTFPVAPDPDRAIYSLFAHSSIPRTIVISPEGVIVYSKAGFDPADLDELNATLESQLGAMK